MKTHLLVSLFVLVGTLGSARAASPEPVKAPTDFKTLDADGDGRISLAEFTAPARAQEARRAKENGKSQRPTGEKPDSDGILSSADTVEGRYSPAVFRQLDINHDDSLSPAELEALFASAHNISQP